MSSLPFKVAFEPHHGEAVDVAPGIQRITATNPGAFTFHGTNTYLAGKRKVMLIDPGPEAAAGEDHHYQAIMAALKGRELTHILISHTHMDHSPLARRLARETGAPVLAEGPHRAARDLHLGEINALDASGDREFEPDLALRHGDLVDNGEIRFEAVFTPGHTANHLAFALKDSPYLFSGDHVMAWATSIVAPPDGNMAAYMASLETLLARSETIYLPGHGGVLEKAREFVRGLRAHRRMREAAILHRIREGDRSISQIVDVIYRDTDPRLHAAAGLSVYAHLEDLIGKGLVSTDGPPALTGEFHPTAEGLAPSAREQN